jgi:hypothetical protein
VSLPAGGAGGLQARFARYAARQLPRVLTQMDRDPDSPTFGSFDRPYWHYKMQDFSSAILQQGLHTLEAIRAGTVPAAAPAALVARWAIGAVNALARQVGRRGGVAEYYPFERSYPAAAFALYAVARVLTDWRDAAPALLASVERGPLERLAAHVARRSETQAANQQAAGLAGLALAARVGLLPAGAAAIERHAARLFAAQHPEGWFPEYGGPDFGYLSVTLDALADYHDATGDERARQAVDRAVAFLARLVGADGRLPSTLNSRNTDYVVPYGLVRAGARLPQAAWLAQTLFSDLGEGHAIDAMDDRYHAHYVFASVVRSLPHLARLVPPRAPGAEAGVWMPGCGIFAAWGADRRWTAYVGARKGGLVRIHRAGGQPPLADHGWRIRAGTRLWTSNWWSPDWTVRAEPKAARVAIEGRCHRVRFHVPGPARHAALRLLAFALRDRIIPLLKRLMIFRPGATDGPRIQRVVEIGPDGVVVTDRLGAWPGARAAPGPRQNVRHVASAESFSAEEWLSPLSGSDAVSLDREQVVTTTWRDASPLAGPGGPPIR